MRVTVEGGEGGGAAPAGEPTGLTLEGLRAELERFRSKTNSELADRRKAIDALKESLARPTDETSAGRGTPEAEPPKAIDWQDRFKLGMEIGGLERALPSEIVEAVRGRVGDPLAAPDLYAQALRVASDAVELRAGKADVTSEESRGGEPVRTRVKPPDAGGAHSAGVPRTYAELQKMSSAERAAWRQRDPDGYARTSDLLYQNRFKSV